jgi:hypothetical protein
MYISGAGMPISGAGIPILGVEMYILGAGMPILNNIQTTNRILCFYRSFIFCKSMSYCFSILSVFLSFPIKMVI